MFFPIQPLTFANFFKIWTRVLSIGFSTYESTIFLRNYFVPDCSDYVEELSAIEKNTLTCENSTEIATLAPLNEQPDSLECTNKKSFIHYTREKPTQHEIFVSTSPELEFCYEEDIQTLGGTVKDGQKVNEWIPDRKTEPIKRDSIPLKDRTKTLNDIRRLDSTADRETVLKIIRSYKQDQTTEKYVQEVIDGLIDW